MQQKSITTDDKIREYVLKKQEQRDRARALREARHTKSIDEVEGDEQVPPSIDFNRSNHTHTITDLVFNNENINHSNQWNPRLLNVPELSLKKPEISSWTNNLTNFPLPSPSNQLDRISKDEMRQIVDMIQQLQGQINNLQFQIDNSKFENQRLKDKIEKLENKLEQSESALNQAKKYSASDQNVNNTTTNTNVIEQNSNTSNPISLMHNNNANNRQKFSKLSNNTREISGHKKIETITLDGNFSSNHTGFETENNSFKLNTSKTHSSKLIKSEPSKNIFEPMDIDENDNNTDKLEIVSKNKNMSKITNGHTNKIEFNIRNETTNEISNMSSDKTENITENENPNQDSQVPSIFSADLPPEAFSTETNERIPCSQCGRKFTQIALEKHKKVCNKVFGQKRKPMDITAMRMDPEALKVQNNPDTSDSLGPQRSSLKRGETKKNKGNDESSNKNEKMDKWKSQSSQLRDAIRNARIISQAEKEGKDISKLDLPKTTVPDTRVPCPYCERKFSQDAADRHIPRCKNVKSRPKALTRKK